MRDYYDELCERAECALCDDEGIRLNGLHVCDHVDYGAISRRGKAAVLQAIKDAKGKP